MKIALPLILLSLAGLAIALVVMIRNSQGGLKKYLKPAPPPDPHRGYPAAEVSTEEIARRVALVKQSIAASGGDPAVLTPRPPSPVPAPEVRKPDCVSHEDIAYWATVNDLTAIGDISAALLEEVRPVILGALGKGARQAGTTVANALRDVEWDWILWYPFAEEEGYSTLDEVSANVAAMTVSERLDLLARPDLLALCCSLGAPNKPKDSRAALVASLLATAPDDQLMLMTEGAVSEHRSKMREQCRNQMGGRLVARIASIADHLDRYDQLSAPDLLSLMPNRRFICLDNAPAHCQKFSGMTLPAAEAMMKFPPLPCGRLNCSCRITAER